MSQLVTGKFEYGSFLTWKQQVLKAIQGYSLENFITGTSAVPSELVNGEFGTLVLSPDLWHISVKINH